MRVLACVHETEEHLSLALRGRSRSSLLAIRAVGSGERTERFTVTEPVVRESGQRVFRNRRYCVLCGRIRFRPFRAQPAWQQMVASAGRGAYGWSFSWIAASAVPAGRQG